MTLNKKVFVTVGTTKFDDLIKIVTSDEVLQVKHIYTYTYIFFNFDAQRYFFSQFNINAGTE